MSDGVDRVMLDIETLGTEPGAVILSIGAVRFDVDWIGEGMHARISQQSCLDAGLHIDEDTQEWWLDQDEYAQEYALEGNQPLESALEDLSEFFGDAEEVWAYSPAFDCVLLEAAYDAVGSLPPWGHWQTRDARTLANLPIAPDLERDGAEHHALEDAQYQARVVGETLGRINGGECSD